MRRFLMKIKKYKNNRHMVVVGLSLCSVLFGFEAVAMNRAAGQRSGSRELTESKIKRRYGQQFMENIKQQELKRLEFENTGPVSVCRTGTEDCIKVPRESLRSNTQLSKLAGLERIDIPAIYSLDTIEKATRMLSASNLFYIFDRSNLDSLVKAYNALSYLKPSLEFTKRLHEAFATEIIEMINSIENFLPNLENYASGEWDLNPEYITIFRKTFARFDYSPLSELPPRVLEDIWSICREKRRRMRKGYRVASDEKEDPMWNADYESVEECFEAIKAKYNSLMAKVVEREENAKKPFWKRRWWY